MKFSFMLKIAGIGIKTMVDYESSPLAEMQKQHIRNVLSCFLAKTCTAPDISISLRHVRLLPRIPAGTSLFICNHPGSGKENWRIFSYRGGYIFVCPLDGKQIVMRINNSGTRVEGEIVRQSATTIDGDAFTAIYSFLQILLMYYLAGRGRGIFMHAAGIKDAQGRGIVFAGKSGAGKTTLARAWHAYSDAQLLNDDRVIIRKQGNGFLVYPGPWSGEFHDYSHEPFLRAPLKRIFFLCQGRHNTVRKVLSREAFSLLYPCLFPVMWDAQCTGSAAQACAILSKSIPCYLLKIVKGKKGIDFIQGLT